MILTPMGSHGDLHPFIGLGMELKRRGHHVVVLTSPHFQKLVERAGLELVAVGTVEEYNEALGNPDIWKPVEGFKLLLMYLLKPLRLMYDRIMEQYVPGESVLVSPPTVLSARIVQEKLGVPTATIHLAPSSLRSVVNPLVLPNIWLPSWTPRFCKRLIFWSADRFLVAPILEGPLNEFRAEVGLPPIRRPMAGWWNSPQRILGLFPDWFAPVASDWPAQTRLCGFPLFDERGMTALPTELEDFLQAGEPPIVFTPGSAMQHGQSFFQSAVDACQRLNRRAILLTIHADHVPAKLPATIRHFSYIPFSEVFPRSAAVVHHGGIGTMSQGLAAGVPQLIMPMGFDQPDNAARLERLAVGASLSPGKFTGANLTAKLQSILRPEVRLRCRELSERLADRRSLARTCDLIEELSRSEESGAKKSGAKK